MDGDILWLGLHKTGTTFLQKSLDLSQGSLQAAGIRWVALDEFRRRWTRPLLHKDHPDAPSACDRPAGLSRWMVFDENIPALVQHALTRDGFYPDAGVRARVVADYLGLENLHLVLGLRSFADFVPSLYCEALKSTPFKPFRRFLVAPPETFSWIPLIDRLLAAFPDAPLLVYRAEDLPGQEARLLGRLTGLPAEAFTLLGKAERLGFSHEAVSRLHALALERPVTRADVSMLVQAHPRNAENRSYAPWGVEERALLDAAYARDIAELRLRVTRSGNRIVLI